MTLVGVELANIRIALDIVGYDVAKRNEFERARAILDVAQEYKALKEDSEILESEHTCKEEIFSLLPDCALKGYEIRIKEVL